MTTDVYFAKIRDWAEARNLIEGSTPEKQFLKLTEELGELAAAMARQQREEQIDAIGDIVVVLTILSAQLKVDIAGCVASAYEVIKDRKGRMVDGVFVKNE